MAIRVIKPGQTEFTATCSLCGCHFSYELVDINYISTGYVNCPTCGNKHFHSSLPQKLDSFDINKSVESIPCSTDPCEGCAWCGDAWRETLKQSNIQVGDTPCTWCYKHQITCNQITCNAAAKN